MRFRRILWVLFTCAVVLPLAATSFAHGNFTVAPDRDSSQNPAGEPLRNTHFSEGFEDAWPPAGWEIIHLGSTYTWASTSAASHGGAKSAWMHYGAQGAYQDEYLVSPAIDLSALGAAYLHVRRGDPLFNAYFTKSMAVVALGFAAAFDGPMLTVTMSGLSGWRSILASIDLPAVERELLA